MKEIRVFSNENKYMLTNEVNNYLSGTKHKICDIQFSTSKGLLVTEYSVMIIIEVNDGDTWGKDE